MTLFAYDPSTDDDHLRRSFQDYDPSNNGSLRRDSAWLSFRTNARMQRSADRGRNHEVEKEEFERDMLLLSMSSYKPSNLSFSEIGGFLGFRLFGRPEQNLSYENI